MMKTFLYTPIVAFLCAQSQAALASVSSLPTNGEASTASGFRDAIKHGSRGGTALCTSGIARVTAKTNANVRFEYELPLTQDEATQTWITKWTAGSSYPSSISNGTLHVNGTYEIGATICVPANHSTTKLQILTHGIGFDRYYWDFAQDWSYVDVAVAAGYSTFFYDRLGVGVSSKGDPLHTIQSPLEMEILHGLVTQLRQGLYRDTSYTKVVGVGHSFGSALTQGLTAAYPSDLDAAILTGFSTNATGMSAFSLGQNPTIASTDQPYRFSGLNNGYFVVASPVAMQQTFFKWPGYDPAILSLADATKGTVTVGELFTTGAVVRPAVKFTGAVALVAGNEDLAFCSGNCSYPHNILADAGPTLYPGVSADRFDTYRAPNAGHGLNLHYTAREAFEWIQEFLEKNGL